jgi:hypothetical protein
MTSTAVAKSTEWPAVAGGVTEGEQDMRLAEANVGAPRNVHQRQTLIQCSVRSGGWRRWPPLATNAQAIWLLLQSWSRRSISLSARRRCFS